MLTFLFWNIQKKPILHRVARICAKHNVDVVILAECSVPVEPAKRQISVLAGTEYAYPVSLSDRIRLYARPLQYRIEPAFDDANSRLSIRRLLREPDRTLLALVHLPSAQGGWNSDDQYEMAREVASQIEAIERVEFCERTLVVGDFNMNPYDNGMVSGFGFHAHLTHDLARRRSRRTVQERTTRKAFFNPMWQFLAERGRKPSGTYYFDAAKPINPYWHVLDHVLVRPELCDKLMSVEVLDDDGTDSLVHEAGRWPDKRSGSDHLPLLFRMDI